MDLLFLLFRQRTHAGGLGPQGAPQRRLEAGSLHKMPRRSRYRPRKRRRTGRRRYTKRRFYGRRRRYFRRRKMRNQKEKKFLYRQPANPLVNLDNGYYRILLDPKIPKGTAREANRIGDQVYFYKPWKFKFAFSYLPNTYYRTRVTNPAQSFLTMSNLAIPAPNNANFIATTSSNSNALLSIDYPNIKVRMIVVRFSNWRQIDNESPLSPTHAWPISNEIFEDAAGLLAPYRFSESRTHGFKILYDNRFTVRTIDQLKTIKIWPKKRQTTFNSSGLNVDYPIGATTFLYMGLSVPPHLPDDMKPSVSFSSLFRYVDP